MTRWLPRRPARTPSSTRALCGRIGSVPRDEFSERAAAVPCHGEPWRGREYREQPSGRGLGPAFGRLGPALGRCFWRFFLQAALRGTPAWLRFAAAQAEYISYLCQISGTASNANSQSSRSPLEGIRKSPRFSSRRSSTASTGLTPLLGALSSTPSSDPHLVASAWTAAAGAGDTQSAPLKTGLQRRTLTSVSASWRRDTDARDTDTAATSPKAPVRMPVVRPKLAGSPEGFDDLMDRASAHAQLAARQASVLAASGSCSGARQVRDDPGRSLPPEPSTRTRCIFR